MANKLSVLFIDDDEKFLNQLIRSVEKRTDDFNCFKATTKFQALESLGENCPDVVVVDLSLDSSMGPDSGIELITDLLDSDPTIRTIVLTGHDSEEWGVKAIRAGAASFVAKPADADHLVALIRDGAAVTTLQRQMLQIQETRTTFEELTGLGSTDKQMQKVLQAVWFAASNDQAVLLFGETGVGKGVVARAIHTASSRSAGKFVRISPHYGSHDLILSELFGHTKGAFTGAVESREGKLAEADGGTLFIDEIDCLPHSTQVALLDVLQERHYSCVGSGEQKKSNFRLICATNLSLDSIASKDALRLDFYHRIAHLSIRIPSLRERRDDISVFAKAFLERLKADNKTSTVRDIALHAINWLDNQSWPGNVRELQAAVERAFHCATFRGARSIKLNDFKMLGLVDGSNGGPSNAAVTLEAQLKQIEEGIVQRVYNQLGHNISATAQQLGTDRKRINRVLQRCG